MSAHPVSAASARPTLRTVTTLGLLLAFHLLPWLRWDGRQALLLDLSARRFDLFGLTLWPQDVGLLLGLLAILSAGLALFTHLCGRLWCGHGCPQTLWSTAFGWIERATRRHLRWPPLERAVRWLLWGALSVWTAITFVGLFVPISALVTRAITLQWTAWESVWVLFYSVATWGNAGFLRRQVCRVLCPFARVQPWLTDAHTPRVLYVAPRGEPRGPRPSGQGSVATRGRGLLDATTAQDYVFRAAHPALAGPLPRFSADRLGDCMDCAACVRACALQLDVRCGPHADCVACGDCMVACDRAQHAAGFEPGLLRYGSPQRAMGARARLLRPRTLVLLGLFGGLLLGGWWML